TEWVPPFYDAEHFRSRPIRLLYLKTGGSLDNHESYINSLPPPIRDGIRDGLTAAVQSPNLQLCDVVDGIFSTAGFDRREKERQFWGVIQTMDDYIRRKRAIDLVNWLKFQDGVVIIGNGWEFIDKTDAKAEFRPAASLDNVGMLWKDTKFLCNTNP